MKYIIITTLFLISISFAATTYESGKIDTHGGNKSYLYDKKVYQAPSMGMSSFLDTNSTKETTKNK